MSVGAIAAHLPPIKEDELDVEPVEASIVDFLTARYDELERVLRCTCMDYGGACGGAWCSDQCQTCSGGDREPQDMGPLDGLAAKRALLAMHTPDREASDPWTRTVDQACTTYSTYDHTIVYQDECQTLQILAWPFRDHADYRPEWGRYLPPTLTGEVDQ